jgi:hypothetical protein
MLIQYGPVDVTPHYFVGGNGALAGGEMFLGTGGEPPPPPPEESTRPRLVASLVLLFASQRLVQRRILD